jgi:hypothetical protein
VTDFAKSLFLKLLRLVRYQAALHPDGARNRPQPRRKQELSQNKSLISYDLRGEQINAL